MKKYNIQFTQTFKDMFESELMKSKYYTTTYANKIKEKTYEAIFIFSLFPYLTPAVRFRGKEGDYRKYVIKHRFLLIYKIEQDTIYLLYFIDGRK